LLTHFACANSAVIAVPRAHSERPSSRAAATIAPPRATTRHAVNSAGAITLLALGSATLVSGLLVGAIAFIPASNALDATCPRRMCTSTAETHALFDRTQQLGWTADLVVAVGAFYAIAGGAWLVAQRAERASEHVRVSITAGANGVAVVASGRF
jgi:hypothetical protein